MADIGETVHLMRQGRRVCRAGWNGKGMWLEMVPSSLYAEGMMMQEFPAMKTVQGTFVPWLCSLTDLLAKDWQALE